MDFSRFEVRVEAPNTTTRPNGVTARKRLKALLESSDRVVVDMENVVLTPSFADEFLGVLLMEVGEDEFRRSVQIVNVSPASRPLLQTVFFRRLHQRPTPPTDRAVVNG